METLANPIFSNNLLIKAQSGGSLAQLELADVYVHGYVVDQDEAELLSLHRMGMSIQCIGLVMVM